MNCVLGDYTWTTGDADAMDIIDATLSISW